MLEAAELLILITAVVAGGIATVTGFGIGSLLTPAFSVWYDAKVAVAAVSVPHWVGTAIRFWMVRGTSIATSSGASDWRARQAA